MSEYLAQGAPGGRRALTRALAALGALAVAWTLVARALDGEPIWVTVVGLVGTLAWIVDIVSLRRDGRLFWALVIVRMASGAISGPPTDVTGLVPALLALLVVIGAPRRSVAATIAAPLGVLVLSALSALISPLLGAHVSVAGVVAVGVALLVTVLASISRRQFRTAEEQSRQLLEQRVESAQERERAAALAERSRIARDIHDVLAHSLGGLVLQLDAAEALLEKGRTDDAVARVHSARGLAASGLEEARRAVAALRDPETALEPIAVLEELLVIHRELGGAADLVVEGTPGPLAPERAAALRSAAREALTNARRHAPGAPVSLRLHWSASSVSMRVSSPLASPAAPSVGGGHGLAGLRERLAAVGGTASAGERDGGFVVEAEVPR